MQTSTINNIILASDTEAVPLSVLGHRKEISLRLCRHSHLLLGIGLQSQRRCGENRSKSSGRKNAIHCTRYVCLEKAAKERKGSQLELKYIDYSST